MTPAPRRYWLAQALQVLMELSRVLGEIARNYVEAELRENRSSRFAVEQECERCPYECLSGSVSQPQVCLEPARYGHDVPRLCLTVPDLDGETAIGLAGDENGGPTGHGINRSRVGRRSYVSG
jgi:hypothetical protein